MRVWGGGIPSVNAHQKSASASSFVYLVGADFRYFFNRTLGLVFSADFNSSAPQFDNVTGSIAGTMFDEESEQVISTVDIGLGLVFAF
ncbi:hypothetical protein [Sphingobacterium sp. SGG-5]|uniref:hypothetical protein n=1 Tax=Sphingobacterium sp. SGG-5 TaxID=2710881 RepID=UPI0019D09F81|nr:hypothetical protein [Sphingobacterium sp. SGG-5]